jgi:hypothetical protein
MNIRTAIVVRQFINKSVVPSRPRQRGNPGYPWHMIARLLVYAVLIGIFTNKGLVRHLDQHSSITRILGLKTIPHRKTIARWKKNWYLLFFVVDKLGDMIRLLIPTEKLIFDSTPIVDYNDPDAKIGFYSRGPFKGFKGHFSVNQLGIPIRSIFTKANTHDSVWLSMLLVKMMFGLGDGGYDSKENRKLIRKLGGKPVISRNPRNGKKKFKTPRMLKKFRYIIEQKNDLLKNQILKGFWTRIRSFESKASFVYCGIIAMQVMALNAITNGMKCLFEISLYRY